MTKKKCETNAAGTGKSGFSAFCATVHGFISGGHATAQDAARASEAHKAKGAKK